MVISAKDIQWPARRQMETKSLGRPVGVLDRRQMLMALDAAIERMQELRVMVESYSPGKKR
jgi:hypothetical protein